MKKKFGRNWLYIGSLSLLLGTGIYSYGCADGWWSYSHISSFTPEAFVDTTYESLLFAPYDRFYGGGYIYNLSMFHSDVVNDWVSYLGAAVPTDIVQECLLGTEFGISESFLLYTELTKGKKKSSLYDLDLKNKRVANFITFLNFAKTIDQYSTQDYDYWDYDNHIMNVLPSDYVEKLELFYFNMDKTDTYFANRMWFQVMKAKFYSDNKVSVISFFDETSSAQPKNTLYYRGMSYVAGAYTENGDFVNSNLLYATVFDKEPTIREVALYNFKALDKERITKISDATTDKDVKAAVWAVSGYYNDLDIALKKVYEINPKSPHIDYLLTRWVNIEEQELNVFVESSFKSREEYFTAIKKKIDQPTLEWINTVASKPNDVANPVLWKLAAGYMDIFQGEYKKAAKHLEVAASLVKDDDTLIKDQVRLFTLINTVSQVKKIDKKTEAKLYPELKWVYTELVKRAYDDPFRYEYASNWIRKFLSAVYKEQGNVVMAEIVHSNGVSFYKDMNQSKAIEAFFLAKEYTDLERLFVDLYKFNLSDIYESRAIELFYRDDVEGAIVEMKKAVPVKVKDYYSDELVELDYQNAQLLGNPFNGKIADCNDCDHEAKQSVKYTKLSFLEKLGEMQENIANGVDVFNNALLLGNAYYNATYFGNARLFYYNAITDEYGSNVLSEGNKATLLSMKNASKYYAIARKHVETKEQGAKIAYFSAKIERNEFYVKEYHSSDYYMGGWGHDIMFKQWNGFNELATKYSDTKYYQEVIKECGYFRRYLGIE